MAYYPDESLLELLTVKDLVSFDPIYDEIWNITEDTTKWNELAPHFVITIDVCIFLIGLLGNLAACTVILYDRSLHTTTNFYLLNLSISDILLLITSAPFIIYSNLYPDKVYYSNEIMSLIDHWILETAVSVSVLTITAFTVERYLAICHPFYSQSMSRSSRVKKILISTWIISMIFAMFLAGDPKYIFECCNEGLIFLGGTSSLYLAGTSLAFTFLIPLAVLIIMYFLIGLKLLRSPKGKHISPEVEKTNRKTLKMLVFIVVVFFLCWAPFHVQRFMLYRIGKVKFKHYATYFTIYNYVNFIKSVTYTISPAVNPIIYTMMSKNFRTASKRMLSKFSGLSRKQSNSSSTNTQDLTL